MSPAEQAIAQYPQLRAEGLFRWAGHLIADTRRLAGPRCAVGGCGRVVWWKVSKDEPHQYLCDRHYKGCATVALALAGATR